MHGSSADHKPGFAHKFYSSWDWRQCKDGYLRHVGHLCERCARKGQIKPATQVHHKKRLTPANISDPAVTLNWENLEALCDECHQEEHRPTIRWRCDPTGHVEL